MTKLSSISFFCPAYNDVGNLPELIPNVSEFLKKHFEKYEIVIIEDGSPDDTGLIADNLAKKFPNIKVVHHDKNKGYSATLKEGFEALEKSAVAEVIVTDSVYSPEQKLWKKLKILSLAPVLAPGIKKWL